MVRPKASLVDCLANEIARTLQVMGLTEEQAIERYGADAVTVHKTT